MLLLARSPIWTQSCHSIGIRGVKENTHADPPTESSVRSRGTSKGVGMMMTWNSWTTIVDVVLPIRRYGGKTESSIKLLCVINTRQNAKKWISISEGIKYLFIFFNTRLSCKRKTWKHVTIYVYIYIYIKKRKESRGTPLTSILL